MTTAYVLIAVWQAVFVYFHLHTSGKRICEPFVKCCDSFLNVHNPFAYIL